MPKGKAQHTDSIAWISWAVGVAKAVAGWNNLTTTAGIHGEAEAINGTGGPRCRDGIHYVHWDV